MQNQGGSPNDQQPGSRDLEDRNNPANHLANSLDDLDRIKKTIDPEENKKKDPVPESMKPDQGSKTIMKLVAMALLIIGAVALGPGVGAAILGTLAGGAGLFAVNDVLGARGNAPLQSKKSKNKEEQADKMHKVEQKALDAALASVEKNIEQINASPMARPTFIPPAKSIPIPEGSKIYSPNEIDEIVRNRVDDAMKKQTQNDKQLGLRDLQMDSQNPSNSGRSSPDITGQDLKGIMKGEEFSSILRSALQDVVGNIRKGGEGRGSGERGGESVRDDERERPIKGQFQETKAIRPDSVRREVYRDQSSSSQGHRLSPPAAARSPSDSGSLTRRAR